MQYCLLGMFTILDYSSSLEYSIIRRYTNIVYYYYYHASEARYDVDCRQRFYTPGRNLARCSDDNLIGDANRKTDEALNKVIDEITRIRQRILT